MKRTRLTNRARAARNLRMRIKQGPGRSIASRAMGAAVLVGGFLALSGCISVNAPDKPIVIELNINIRQEVVYRLAEDAKNTIESNPEIF